MFLQLTATGAREVSGLWRGNLMAWSAAYRQCSWVIRGVTEEGAMELFTLGIDLGKTTFHVVGMNQGGEAGLSGIYASGSTPSPLHGTVAACAQQSR